ncbi:hypothetical protein BDB01DRAFT_847759 [Pilobolus umbonatus]|nr:hypothetical protein BDB01DRAFT_847759 [Pilobolus umbonatus]
MGCCSSIPQDDDNPHPRQHPAENHDTPIPSTTSKSEINKCKLASSVHSDNIEKSHVESVSSTSTPIHTASASAITWPIFVRLSNNGQDISIQAPTEPPYLTVNGLRKQLYPHLDTPHPKRVKLIYLGRILPDEHIIIPTMTDTDAAPPVPKNRIIRIQREGVIQAMVSRAL